ncbi:DNA-binding transcriptional regulator [Rhodococcus sp. 1168]|uniref:helix-turn-helix domain-containing protein n=1 Tax=Rhodococcus sp. 1168 TaxID=2018041 RepID=UPI000A0DD045|nr:DUF1870 family protein [Rhodococcus sp. 1168]ORI13429.1 hypothetical protein BJI47_22560 [Rhodococcus sp. 1168]
MTSSGYVQTMREDLGLTGDEFAGQLGVNPRTLRSWESGRDSVPDRIQAEIAEMLAERDHQVDALTADLAAAGSPAVVPVWRSDAEMHAARPSLYPHPARWWRHVVARTTGQVDGVIVETHTIVDLPDWELLEVYRFGPDRAVRAGWEVVDMEARHRVVVAEAERRGLLPFPFDFDL